MMYQDPRPRPLEKRMESRRHTNGLLLWRPSSSDEFRTAVALEESDRSLAFALRGHPTPAPGLLLEVQRDMDGLGRTPKKAVVRRSRLAHDDLAIVAVEFVSMSPFPPVAAHAAVVAELRPLSLQTRPRELAA